MKQNQLLFAISLLILTAISQLWAATTPKLVEQSTCKGAKDGNQCYLAYLPESINNDTEISIAVNFFPAKGTRLNPYPLVWLNGGPGNSNMEPPLPDWIWKNFDVLNIGYRGIDGVPTLDCPGLKKQFKRETKNHDELLLGQGSLSRLSEEVVRCQSQLESEGWDTQAYGIYDVVSDINQVRTLLNIPKINLLSASYGTRIAWYFDQLYPGIVDRNLIISGNPDGGFNFDAKHTEQQLINLENICNKDDKCRERAPNLREMMTQVLNNLPEKAWGVHLDRDHLRLVTFMLMYSRNTMPLMIDAYAKAAEGNYSGLAAMQKFPNPFTANQWYWGVFFSAGAIDLDSQADYAGMFTKTSQTTVLNTPLSELIFAGMTVGWEARPYSPLENQLSDTPTLILASDIDVATPKSRIESDWLPYLNDGAIWTIEGAGHAPDHIFAGGDALAADLSEFLATGDIEANQAHGTPIDFEPSFSLTWLTYGFWSLIAGLSIGLLIYGIALL